MTSELFGNCLDGSIPPCGWLSICVGAVGASSGGLLEGRGDARDSVGESDFFDGMGSADPPALCLFDGFDGFDGWGDGARLGPRPGDSRSLSSGPNEISAKVNRSYQCLEDLIASQKWGFHTTFGCTRFAVFEGCGFYRELVQVELLEVPYQFLYKVGLSLEAASNQ